ncbi:MAG: hypothetical protein ACK4NR_09130 [Micavibrio sp.]
MNKIFLPLLAGLFLFSHPVFAQKVCDYPAGTPVLSTDYWLVSKNCAGTRKISASDLASYTYSVSPGTAGQVLFNSGGSVTTGSAASIRSLLGLSTVAATGAYSDLSGLPTLGTMAAASTGDYYTSTSIDTLLGGKSDTGHSHNGLAPTGGGSGQVLKKNSATNYDYSWADDQAGTVTSVGITAPAAGISVAGSPITSSGSMTLSLTNDLAAVEALSGTGYAKRTASDTWSTAATIPSSDITGLGTMAAEDAINYTSTGGLAAVALSGDRDDLLMEPDADSFFDYGESHLIFYGQVQNSINLGSAPIFSGSSGGGALSEKSDEVGHPGIYNFTTGTTSNNSAQINWYVNHSRDVRKQVGCTYTVNQRMRMVSKPASAKSLYWVGFTERGTQDPETSSSNSHISIGLVHRPNHSTNGDNWRVVLRAGYTNPGSHIDSFNTSVPVVYGQWYDLEVTISVASENYVDITMKIDGVIVHQQTGFDISMTTESASFQSIILLLRKDTDTTTEATVSDLDYIYFSQGCSLP